VTDASAAIVEKQVVDLHSFYIGSKNLIEYPTNASLCWKTRWRSDPNLELKGALENIQVTWSDLELQGDLNSETT